MFQWSSFSHPTANDPNFYYPDPHAEGFKVLIDIKGPGSLNHWWSTGGMSPPVGLKFYFDDEETPRLSTTIGEWCKGGGPLGQADRPSVNFLPMSFRKRCVVSTDGPRGEAFHHGWLKPNRDKIHIESLCMYYLNPAASLLLTDELDVGDPRSEKEHGYTVRGEVWSGEEKLAYQGEETVLIADRGRKFDGSSEFRVGARHAIPPSASLCGRSLPVSGLRLGTGHQGPGFW
jgi:hypothetical protein